MDRELFESAVERYQRRVFTLASYLLSDPAEAEDVTQEVLIKLWRRGAGVDPQRLQGWLLQVTRNASYDRLRRRRSASKVFAAESDPRADATDHQPDPESLAGASEFGRRLAFEVAKLKEPAKSIVILREVQGMSYQQIAEVLEMPVGTVRVTLHRGRRQLRNQLREVYHHVSVG